MGVYEVGISPCPFYSLPVVVTGAKARKMLSLEAEDSPYKLPPAASPLGLPSQPCRILHGRRGDLRNLGPMYTGGTPLKEFWVKTSDWNHPGQKMLKSCTQMVVGGCGVERKKAGCQICV